MTRTMTLSLVPAKDAAELAVMGDEERRRRSGGSTTFELFYPGAPDALARAALEGETSSGSETSAIVHADLAGAAETMERSLRDRIALARRLVDRAESGEDPARVARALAQPMTDPARGPAEEAATYVRVLLEHVPAALELGMSVAWEIAASDAEVAHTTTPLPTDIGAFAREVAEALGGEIALELARNPTCAIRVGGHSCVIVWRYGIYYRIGLPHSAPFVVRSREDFLAQKPAIQRALAGHRPVLTMADVVASLSRPWNLVLGDPRPEEALLFCDRGDVSLKQNESSVTISIREAHATHARELSTLADLAGLEPWIDEHVASQAAGRRAARAAFDAERERTHAAMMQNVPDCEDVLGALRAGHTVQVGGGRSFVTYAIRDGRPILVRTDDGFTEEVACSEQMLRDAIAEAPHVFASVVEHWRAGPRR